MATSLGQYAPVFLPEESPSLTEKPGRPQSTGLQRVGHDQNDPVHIEKTFLACGSSTPVRVESDGDTAAWLAGTLVAPSVQRHGLPPRQELWPRVFFRASCSWRSEGLFGQSFSIAPPIQALGGFPCLGSFSVVPRVRHIEGAPLAGVLLCRSAPQAL